MDKELIIFDLDQTLVDTSALESLRRERLWLSVYREIPKTICYESLNESIVTLRDKNIKVAIFTSSPKAYAQRVLAYHNLEYDLLLGYHDVRNRKPSAEGFLMILDHFSIEPKKAISFGDQGTDILASKKADIDSVACLWGNVDNAALIDSKPNLILQQSADILSIL